VEFARDEQVQNVAVGNSTAWQVSVNSRRNLIFVKPAEGASNTNMTVFTNLRTYTFELRAMPALTPEMPFNVSFRASVIEPAADPAGYIDMSMAERRASRYRITGDPALQPDSVSHDRRFTFVTWPKERDLPATYEVNAAGQEVLVNGIMRNDELVIDRVITMLRFRRDSKKAEAVLVYPKGKR
jgi:type IV secretion system protein VirB9